jgi:hypothetical protein
MDDFSLARPAGHLIMGDGSGPDGLAKQDGAKALSGAESVDTAPTPLDKPSRTKNLIIEFSGKAHGYQGVRQALCDMRYARVHLWVGSPIFEKRLSAVDNCKTS